MEEKKDGLSPEKSVKMRKKKNGLTPFYFYKMSLKWEKRMD